MTIEQLQSQIDSLQQELNKLRNTTTIPYEVEQAFRFRLGIDNFTQLDASSKTTASETQAVNEAGASSYNVAKPMDGFKQVTIGGSTLYIPYYT